jgi:hypothetical protein
LPCNSAGSSPSPCGPCCPDPFWPAPSHPWPDTFRAARRSLQKIPNPKSQIRNKSTGLNRINLDSFRHGFRFLSDERLQPRTKTLRPSTSGLCDAFLFVFVSNARATLLSRRSETNSQYSERSSFCEEEAECVDEAQKEGWYRSEYGESAPNGPGGGCPGSDMRRIRPARTSIVSACTLSGKAN